MKTLIARIYRFLILVFLFFFSVATPIAHGVALKWNSNSEMDLAGYRVYYGTSSGHYNSVVDLGKATKYNLCGLSEGETYYFTVTAYDFSNNESAFASELDYFLDDGIPEEGDNCPIIPNGPNLGTCVRNEFGVVHSYRVGNPKQFIICTADADCAATGGICQMMQGDYNGNGYGDVCDCYADFNQDGRVSIPDYSLMRQEYGRFNCSEQNSCHCDANQDGKITTFDFILLKQEYGKLNCPIISAR